jgi:hypothetical protein
MDNCNCKKPSKKPFPAMSAHFAHTLDDMKEKYLEAKYFDLETEEGVFEESILNDLISSRSNLITYENNIFRLIKTEDNNYIYINVSDYAELFKCEVSLKNKSWKISKITQTSDSAIYFGYYYDGVFWKEKKHINPLPIDTNKIYFDLLTEELYYYSLEASSYKKLIKEAKPDSNTPGLVKLYSTLGSNDDGTTTQKTITSELNKKIEVSLEEASDECLKFIGEVK